MSIKLIQKDEQGFERIVFAEVLLPDTPNTHGDIHTMESIREFAYGFMINGFAIDVDHDNEARQDIYILESFIAREGDTTFVEGSWVVAMYVENDEIWQDVLDGEITGYSWEAFINTLPVEVQMADSSTRFGNTEADPYDGHTHEYFVWVDLYGVPTFGGTTESNGHTHTISGNVRTDVSFSHRHIINIVEGAGGI